MYPDHNTISSNSVPLSIVIVVLKSWQTLERCLRALIPQVGAINAEVIVVADSRNPAVAQLKKFYPKLIFLISDNVQTYAKLRTDGILIAKGTIVAITEDHCIPQSDWCQKIIESHREPYAGIGGVVEKEAPDMMLNWAVYFADYLRYMKPIIPGQARSLTDLNASYKREKLDTIKDIWKLEFHENLVNDSLIERGEILWLSPDIVVRQQRSFSYKEAFYDRYAFGRLLASTRVKSSPNNKRLVFTLLSLMVPFLLILRTIRQILQKRLRILEYTLSFPFLVLLSFAWGLGEFAGYLTGIPEKNLSVQE